MIDRSGTLTVALADARAAKRKVWTSAQWHEYFRRNAANLMPISWDLGVKLTPDERDAVAASMQQFQLGESSDGRRFMAMGFDHAAVFGDRGYPGALRRLIAEEQRHGRDLGRVMESAGIPTLRRCWADSLFRWLRHTSGLERSIYVLVTAEIIAQVYYDALRDATGSIVLRQLCTQILRDEDEHVRFQCERLAILRQKRWWHSIVIKHAFYRGFFVVIGLAFWWKHSSVMRAGGYGFFGFWKAAWRKLHVAVRLMNPRHYDWSDPRPNPPPEYQGREKSGDDFDLQGSWLEL
jgi:hypothetical protein